MPGLVNLTPWNSLNSRYKIVRLNNRRDTGSVSTVMMENKVSVISDGDIVLGS